MRCAWDAFTGILPQWMRYEVDKLSSSSLQELRLRLHKPPELITVNNRYYLSRSVTEEDLQFCINTASRYSPWAAQTVKQGYITAPGGHRIGLCGQASVSQGRMVGIRVPNSLCLRVARDFPGIAGAAKTLKGSVLIVGRPGSGKTTLLRDLIRLRSEFGQGSVGVVDEKGEIFPVSNHMLCFETGKHTDVISGCTKSQGMDMILRNMGPTTIAVDEITAEEDSQALANAAWCGVDLLATAHARDKKELYSRQVYKPIIENKIFSHLLVLRQDKSWYTERLE